MNTTIALMLIAVCFGGVAWGIRQVAQRAKTCAAHDPMAGRAAVVLGYLCGIISVGLLIAAVIIPRE